MSIIERVADLLGTEPQAQKKHSAVSQAADNAAQDSIERAVAEISRRQDAHRVREPASDPRSGKTARPANRSTPDLKIDRNRLRRQSMVTPDGERTAITESFRHIKRQILGNVLRQRVDAPPANLVLVTSALEGEGKTFCAVNLAISIALEMDRTVLLVDADAAKAGVAKALGFEAQKGLMDLLNEGRIDLSEVLRQTDIDKLALLPAGAAHLRSTELLASDTMRTLLQEIAERHPERIVIFDSPPLLEASEASVLAGLVGQIIVVVEAGRTSEAALKEALGQIDSSKVTGLLLNKGNSPRLGYGYGGYGSGAR